MKRVLALLAAWLMTMLTFNVFAAEPKDPYAEDYAKIASVIIFGVDHTPRVVVFVAKDGETAAIAAANCKADPECNALVLRAIKDDKADAFDIESPEST